jgi:hypothetical protein
MSMCTVLSELLNANERKEMEAFNSDNTTVDRKWKSLIMNLRAPQR